MNQIKLLFIILLTSILSFNLFANNNLSEDKLDKINNLELLKAQIITNDSVLIVKTSEKILINEAIEVQIEEIKNPKKELNIDLMFIFVLIFLGFLAWILFR